jgi:hypothetical protein
MYEFTTKDNEILITRYAPVQIQKFYCFDAIDKENQLKVVETEKVDFTSFIYIN